MNSIIEAQEESRYWIEKARVHIPFSLPLDFDSYKDSYKIEDDVEYEYAAIYKEHREYIRKQCEVVRNEHFIKNNLTV